MQIRTLQVMKYNIIILIQISFDFVSPKVIKENITMDENYQHHSYITPEDDFIWVTNSKGTHAVKDFYHPHRKEIFRTGNELFRRQLWKQKIHERHKPHLWRIASSSLPWTHVDSMPCPLCGARLDGFRHLFSGCAFLRIAWREC